jgi:hypothetical protein
MFAAENGHWVLVKQVSDGASVADSLVKKTERFFTIGIG